MTPRDVPPDHQKRMQRVRLPLEGLSLGDGFGQRHFFPECLPAAARHTRVLPTGPWHYTDDTVMALGIAAVLGRHGAIVQDDLADEFARRYAADPARGYGAGANGILEAICKGNSWKVVSRSAFEGMGSMGNGAAMRVAPLGAYFAEDLDRLVHDAVASAEVTHAHPEGQAGAVAVALAAAYAWLRSSDHTSTSGEDLLTYARDQCDALERLARMDSTNPLDAGVR